jgi:integrase
MEIYRQEGSKFWTADFVVNGRRVRKSTKQTTKTKAQEVGIQMMRQAASGVTPTRSLMPTLEQFGKETFLPFLEQCTLDADTTRCYRNGYRLLKGTGYQSTPLDLVCFSDVDTLKVPGGPSNTNNLRRTISRILSLAIDKKVLKTRPARIKMVKENVRTSVYDPKMEKEMLGLAEQPLRDIAMTVFDAGMRPAEIVSMEWSHFLWDKNLIFVPGRSADGHKSKEGRYVPMSDRLKAEYRVRAQGSTSKWAYPSKRKKGDHISYFGPAKQFTELRKLVGIPEDLVLYSARHTFGTDIMEQTGNIKLVQEVMGHENVTTTQRYLHPDKSKMADHINERNRDRARRAELAEQCHTLRHSPEIVQ